MSPLLSLVVRSYPPLPCGDPPPPYDVQKDSIGAELRNSISNVFIRILRKGAADSSAPFLLFRHLAA